MSPKSVTRLSAVTHDDPDLDITNMAVQFTEHQLYTPGFEEEGELSGKEVGVTTQENDQLMIRTNLPEAVRGIRSYIGWHQIPEFEASSSSTDDNPFSGARHQLIRKSCTLISGCVIN